VISELKHFVAVAQSRSFTRASEQFHASQSVISRSIRRLEDRIGVCLIHRSTRTVELTAAGEAFLEDSIAILSRLAIATDNARRIEQGGFATLRVGICETALSSGIVKGIAAFRKEFPDVDLRLQAMMGNLQLDALRESRLDVGIMQWANSYPNDLQWQVIARHSLAVALPAAWGYPDGEPISLIALKDRPWVMPSKELASAWRDALIGLCRRAGFEPRIVAIVDDPLTARISIAAGIGATFVHDKGQTDRVAGIQLLHFTDPQGLPPNETAVVWPAGMVGLPLQGLIRHLAFE